VEVLGGVDDHGALLSVGDGKDVPGVIARRDGTERGLELELRLDEQVPRRRECLVELEGAIGDTDIDDCPGCTPSLARWRSISAMSRCGRPPARKRRPNGAAARFRRYFR
jgi:hypothetical protein